MNDFDFSFENAPWEEYLEGIDDTASAMTLLTLLEEEEEDIFEDAMLALEERAIAIDLSDLPRATASGEAAVRLRQEMQLVKTGLKPEKLEEGDPLRLYLEEVAATPAFGDVQLLAEKCAAGNEKAMEQLTNLCLSRVIGLAAEHTGYGVLLMDLIQEGSLGLWQAIGSFAVGDFEAHADKFIRFAMAKAILTQARQSGVGQKMRTALEDYRSVDERLLSELGRNPTQEEIAEYLHISPESAAAIGKMLENARRLQQAKRNPEEEEEEQEAQQQAVEDTAYFQSRQRVNEMLSGLTEKEAKLIALRFGLEGGLPLSPEDTGRKLGLTPDEVVAMEAAALAKMRKQ
jgi:RNA polymerase primary sigma factor